MALEKDVGRPDSANDGQEFSQKQLGRVTRADPLCGPLSMPRRVLPGLFGVARPTWCLSRAFMCQLRGVCVRGLSFSLRIPIGEAWLDSRMACFFKSWRLATKSFAGSCKM